jgi:hypothetical protein
MISPSVSKVNPLVTKVVDRGLDFHSLVLASRLWHDGCLPNETTSEDVLRALKADALIKHIPVIVLSGLGPGNEAKLLKERATAFLMKSMESFDSNSLALIQALQSLLTESKA